MGVTIMLNMAAVVLPPVKGANHLFARGKATQYGSCRNKCPLTQECTNELARLV